MTEALSAVARAELTRLIVRLHRRPEGVIGDRRWPSLVVGGDSSSPAGPPRRRTRRCSATWPPADASAIVDQARPQTASRTSSPTAARRSWSRRTTSTPQRITPQRRGPAVAQRQRRLLAARQAGHHRPRSSSSRSTYQRALEGELRQDHRGDRRRPDRDRAPGDPAGGRLHRRRRTRPPPRCWSTTSAGAPLTPAQVQAIVHLVVVARARARPPTASPSPTPPARLLKLPARRAPARHDAGRSRRSATERTTASQQPLQTHARQRRRHRATPSSRVDADLDFDQTDTTTETIHRVRSWHAAADSDSTSKETYNGYRQSGAPAASSARTDIAVPTRAPRPAATTTTSRQSDDREQRGRHTARPRPRRATPGTIKRLHGRGRPRPAPWPGRQRADGQPSSSPSAAGIDTTRGDTSRSSTLPFDTTAAARGHEASSTPPPRPRQRADSCSTSAKTGSARRAPRPGAARRALRRSRKRRAHPASTLGRARRDYRRRAAPTRVRPAGHP